MADPDLDSSRSHNPPSPTNSSSDSDSDEPLLNYTTLSGPLPRRGTKDFETHGTTAQISALEASREAMREALSVGRRHPPKGGLVGWFDVGEGGEGDDEIEAAQEQELQKAEGMKGNEGDKKGYAGEKNIAEVRRREKRPVVIPKPTGQHIRTMGLADREGRLWLRPEEALYLVERGTLEVRYRVPASSPSPTLDPDTKNDGGIRDREGDGTEDREEGWDGISMSLQACYACFFGMDGLDLERYTVYAGLRRSGYIVLRAGGWYGDAGPPLPPPPAQQQRAPSPVQERNEGWGLWTWFYNLVGEGRERERGLDERPLGPLVQRRLYRSYGNAHSLLHFRIFVSRVYVV